jgi:hypothetical protein
MDLSRVDRRTAIKWLMTATAALPLLDRAAFGAPVKKAQGYGPDPDMQRIYKPGDLWPLTFTDAQRQLAAVLCDTIIPADAESPSASSVGVVDFIDEWISAPYEPDGENYTYQLDRATILEGFDWLDAEGQRRFGKKFVALDATQRAAICDDICHRETAKPGFEKPAIFFALYRDLTAGGFYTTPEGTRDLKYIGNVPMATFDGPPPEVLKHVGLL